MRHLSLIAVFVVAAGLLPAQEVKGRWGIGGGLGAGDFTAPKSTREGTSPSLAVGAWLRYGVSDKLEALAAFDNVRANGKSDFASAGLQALTGGVRFHAGEIPFFDLGLGAGFPQGSAPNKSDRPVILGRAGFGLEYPLTDSLALDVQTQYLQVFPQGRYEQATGALSLTAGVSWFFYCEGTVRRPPPPPPPAPPPPADADGDGVPDARDSCPATPAGAPVDGMGCPTDSDEDGVMDYEDNCPDTKRGVLVNAEGCPAEKVSVTLSITFPTGKTVIDSSFDPQLKKVADFLKRFPETTMVIEGHSDNVGRPAANRALSQKRAEAVREQLIQKFEAPANRLTAKGFGPDQPVADNNTAEGRAANRRVVATISADKPK